VSDQERLRVLESEIERRLAERFAALREEFERLRVESDGRWAGFTSRFDQKISGIVPVELLAPEAGKTPPSEGTLALAAARELDGSATQVEILQKLLDLCRRHASRAILLVRRDNLFGVWKAAGLAGGSAAESLVRRAELPGDSGSMAQVVEGIPCRLEPGNETSARLSCGDAVDAVIVPMVIGEKISGALYADATRGSESRFDPESVALLVYLCGLLVERLPSRKLKPSPVLHTPQRRAPHAPPPTPDEYNSQMVSLWKEFPPMGSREAREPQREDEPPRESSVSPPARALGGPLAPLEESEKRADARRFAQFLVSEIKLYNERAVEEGRSQGNLYKRLKEEIDLSRQIYEQRVPESVRAGSDFLYEELVRILADGRAEALGL
jgi:hypothetical protein